MINNETFEYLTEKEASFLKGLLADRGLVEKFNRVAELRKIEAQATGKAPYKITSEGFTDAEKQRLEKNTNDHILGALKENVRGALKQILVELDRVMRLPTQVPQIQTTEKLYGARLNATELLYESFQRKNTQKVKVQGKRTPALAPYTSRVKRIRAKYKGVTFYAQVNAKGMIINLEQGNKDYMFCQTFASPSAAASAVIDKGRKNGWLFWSYEETPGNWVQLEHVRTSNWRRP